MNKSRVPIFQLLVPILYVLAGYFVITPWKQLILFTLGLYLAIGLLIADEKILYRYYSLSSDQAVKLITRSALFLLALVPLALFVVTSTGSILASGLVMGLWIGLMVEMFYLRANPVKFHQQLLHDLKKELTLRDIDSLLIMGIVGFVLLNVLMLV